MTAFQVYPHRFYRTFQTCALTSPPADAQVISTINSREFSGFLLQRKVPSMTVPKERSKGAMCQRNSPSSSRDRPPPHDVRQFSQPNVSLPGNNNVLYSPW